MMMMMVGMIMVMRKIFPPRQILPSENLGRIFAAKWSEWNEPRAAETFEASLAPLELFTEGKTFCKCVSLTHDEGK